MNEPSNTTPAAAAATPKKPRKKKADKTVASPPPPAPGCSLFEQSDLARFIDPSDRAFLLSCIEAAGGHLDLAKPKNLVRVFRILRKYSATLAQDAEVVWPILYANAAGERACVDPATIAQWVEIEGRHHALTSMKRLAAQSDELLRKCSASLRPAASDTPRQPSPVHHSIREFIRTGMEDRNVADNWLNNYRD